MNQENFFSLPLAESPISEQFIVPNCKKAVYTAIASSSRNFFDFKTRAGNCYSVDYQKEENFGIFYSLYSINDITIEAEETFLCHICIDKNNKSFSYETHNHKPLSPKHIPMAKVFYREVISQLGLKLPKGWETLHPATVKAACSIL